MTDFLKEEMVRLVRKLPETDPRSPDYQMLLRSIECLDAMGQTIEGIVELVNAEVREDMEKLRELDAAKVVELSSAIKAKAASVDHAAPFTAAEFPEEPPDDPMDEAVKGTTVAENATAAPVTEPKTYSSSEVRKALVDARGKGVDVKAVLAAVGAENFAAVPAAKYGEVMAKLEVVE